MSDRRDGRLSNPDLQRRLKDFHLQMEARETADLDALMRTDFGRRWYYRIVFQIGILESPSYQTGGQGMAYQEGKRAIAIHLRDEAQAVCPELWIRMLQERLAAAEYESSQRHETERSHGEGD